MIIIDSREQNPLVFRKEIPTVRRKLDVGDYGFEINGTLLSVIFERKSVEDLFGTLSSGYDRFKDEINRASDAKIILVLAIEVPLSVVKEGIEHSKRSPNSVIQQCFTLMVRHRVPCMFFHDRRDMAAYITQVFLAFEREYDRAEKDKRRTKGTVAKET